jgi:hypothetical protein
MASDARAPCPHFHSVDQMLDAVQAGVRASQLAHAACTEPTLIPLQVLTPAGERVTLATASAQPLGKRRRDAERGSHHACHLFKHANAGVVPYLKELLNRDAALKAAVLAAPELSTSKGGRRITSTSLLAASLADKVWSQLSDAEKMPWKAAASARTLEGVDWPGLAATAKRCRTFVRFVAALQARVGTNGVDDSGLPPLLRLFMP